MAYNAKNYQEQGGKKWVIGGELEVLDGATVSGITGVAAAAKSTTLGGVKAATRNSGDDTVEIKIDSATSRLYAPTYPVIPKAEHIADADEDVKTQFNALLAALIEAGLMASE